MIVFSTGIEAGTGLADPGEVTMTKDLGIGVVGLQGAKKRDEGLLLGRGAGVGRLAIGIEASLITNAYTVGVVTTGVGSYHVLRAALMQVPVLGDVVVVAGGGEAPGLVTGLEGFGGEVARDARG